MLNLIDNSKIIFFLQSPSSPKEFSQPLTQFQKLWIFSFLVNFFYFRWAPYKNEAFVGLRALLSLTTHGNQERFS